MSDYKPMSDEEYQEWRKEQKRKMRIPKRPKPQKRFFSKVAKQEAKKISRQVFGIYAVGRLKKMPGSFGSKSK